MSIFVWPKRPVIWCDQATFDRIEARIPVLHRFCEKPIKEEHVLLPITGFALEEWPILKILGEQ